MKEFFDLKFLKFLLVGVANTLVGTAVMLACYNLLGLGYWVSTAANYVCGSVLSYFLNKHVTFQSKEPNSLPRFIVNILACYLAAYGIARPLVHGLLAGWEEAVRDNASMLVGLVLFTLLNYLGQRRFVFADRRTPEER